MTLRYSLRSPLAFAGATALFATMATVARSQESQNYVISNFSPTSGPIGTQVTLNGSGLATTTSVKVAGVNASFTKTQYAFQVVVTIPSGATTGSIVCSNGTKTATSPTVFTVTTSSTAGGSGGGTTTIDPPPHVNPPLGALTSHPRMWVRGSDLSRLRGWAVPTNPIWRDLQQVATLMRSHMILGYVPGLDNGDGEGNGYQYPTEEYAEMFAFMSLVDPDPNLRLDWAKRAHDLLMVVLTEAAKGPAANQPFRTPHFGTFNRMRWFGEAFPLVVDWCYGTFSSDEKATIRKVFIRWCRECQDPNVAGGSYVVAPVGAYSSPTLVASPGQSRWAGNNYWCNHARQIGMMALALDAVDDVPAVSGDPKAGYLGDFIRTAIEGFLYVRNYGENHDLRGGVSPEGPSYGESSFSGIAMLLAALHTAGYDDPNVYGPSAAIGTGAFWTSDVLTAYTHTLSPQTTILNSWQPPMFLPAGFGDVNRFETNDMIRAFGPLAIIDLADGVNSPRLNAIRWTQTWLSPGGPAYLDQRLTSSITNYGSLLPILYFLTFDPTATAPSDPRQGTPTDYVASGLNRILSRTDWSSSASWFAFLSTFNSIDHQWGDSNSFSFYRNGEFLTKEWSGYGNNLGSVDFQNNLSIQNPVVVTSNTPSFIVGESNHGSQYSYMSAGDPVVRSSFGPGYAFAEGDSTKRYNVPSLGAADVLHASRSIFFLKPDFVVVYDRATSKSANRYKRAFFNFATAPSITGSVATVTTPKGQRVYVTSAGPTATSLTWDQPSTFWSYQESTTDEPMHFRLCVQDPTNPTDARLLNVIQGADSAASRVAVQTLATSGSPYYGVTFGSTVALFARNLGQTFASLSYVAPATATTQYVTGLTPGGGYTVVKGASGAVTITPGGSTIADAAGVIQF